MICLIFFFDDKLGVKSQALTYNQNALSHNLTIFNMSINKNAMHQPFCFL